MVHFSYRKLEMLSFCLEINLYFFIFFYHPSSISYTAQQLGKYITNNLNILRIQFTQKSRNNIVKPTYYYYYILCFTQNPKHLEKNESCLQGHNFRWIVHSALVIHRVYMFLRKCIIRIYRMSHKDIKYIVIV